MHGKFGAAGAAEGCSRIWLDWLEGSHAASPATQTRPCVPVHAAGAARSAATWQKAWSTCIASWGCYMGT
jgi:hypothetical protein